MWLFLERRQRAHLTFRDRVGRTLCCHFHNPVAATHLGRRGAQFPSVMSASLVFVCACRTSFTSQPSILAVLPKQSQPPGFPEQSSAPAAGFPQSPLTACLLFGPPRTACHLPGSPLAQCPSSLLLIILLLHFISRAGCPSLLSFHPWGLPSTPPCAPQPPEFARGPSRRQKVPTAAAQTVFANNVTHLVFHHSGMRGCLASMSVSLALLSCQVLSLPNPSSLTPLNLTSCTSSQPCPLIPLSSALCLLSAEESISL